MTATGVHDGAAPQSSRSTPAAGSPAIGAPPPDGAPDHHAGISAGLRVAPHERVLLRGLASGVAHHFNNLLAVIGAYGELLAHDLDGDDPRHADVRQVLDAVQRGATLTRRLATAAGARAGRPRLVELAPLCARLAPALDTLLGDGVQLEVRLPDDLPPVFADPAELETALVDLAENARDALRSRGAGTVRLDAAADDDGAVLLTITDDGHGMDEETLERARDLFFSTRPPAMAAGLGLPATIAVLERVGGRLTLESTPGVGTVATLHFPPAGDAALADAVRHALDGPRAESGE